jgi:hypothetical protein
MKLDNLNHKEILKIVEVLQFVKEDELAAKIFAQFNIGLSKNKGDEKEFFKDINNWRAMDLS